MGWASTYITKLQEGETVTFRPRGSSMKGKVESGQLCTVEPLKEDEDIEVGDIVLCKVKGKQYLHLVHKKDPQGRLGIGNNRGYFNGWVSRNTIYGKLTKVED